MKECKVKKCEASHLKRSEPVFSYQLGSFTYQDTRLEEKPGKNHRLAPANATVKFSLGKLLSCGGELCGKTCNKFVRENRKPPSINYTTPFLMNVTTHVTVLRLLGQRRRLFLQVLGAGVWLRLHGLQMQYRPQVMQQ